MTRAPLAGSVRGGVSFRAMRHVAFALAILGACTKSDRRTFELHSDIDPRRPLDVSLSAKVPT